MEYEMYNNELMHTGVKGMRWGHRKDPYSGYNRIPRPGAIARKAGSTAKKAGKVVAKKAGATAKKAGKAAVSYAHRKAEERRNKPVTSKTLKKVPATSLSDEDLQKAINRLKKEQEYNKLINELNPKKTHAGKEAVKQFKDELPGKISKEMSDKLSKELASFVFGDSNGNKNKNNNQNNQNNNKKQKKDEEWQRNQRKKAMGDYLENKIDRKKLNEELRNIRRDGNEDSRQKRLVGKKMVEEILAERAEKKKEDE